VAVKIKLKRLGKIRAPYYRIVVADARTKRDGRAIEEIGKYHPKAEPSLIEVDSERAQHWLSVGAQPTDPVRKILEVTGDWQKFKGLPGAEGTLRVAAPKQDRKEIFAAAAAEALAESGATTPKGGGRGRAKAGDTAKADASAKADVAAKADAPAKGGKADKAEVAGKADGADKADGAKAEAPAKASAKADAPAKDAKADAPAQDAKAEAPAKDAKADAPAQEAKAAKAAAEPEQAAAEPAGSEPGSEA
jgi:small subunit ribosomal protein S16